LFFAREAAGAKTRGSRVRMKLGYFTSQSRSVGELKQAIADSARDYPDFRAQEGKAPEKARFDRRNPSLNPATR
jgi:predicted HicB family RNase H-like nuclease